LSDIGGRKWVYVGSILLYAILNIGTALAYNLPMLIIFQFLCGAAGSTALSNVAGTIADLFGDADNAGQPMALFVAAANIGPSLGSPVGEWIAINPNLSWRWSKLPGLDRRLRRWADVYSLLHKYYYWRRLLFCALFHPGDSP